MLNEVGVCKGIENYSAVLSGRAPGSMPTTLLDYFPRDFLLFVDESHVTLPQVRAMYGGDYARKKTLVEYGFRLPSAFDNRPLKFEEVESKLNQTIFVSATPGPYEQAHSTQVAEQVNPAHRPAGPAHLGAAGGGPGHRPAGRDQRPGGAGRAGAGHHPDQKDGRGPDRLPHRPGVKVKYMHHEVDTFERMELIRDLRTGAIDVIVGINLLREGLDLPEVSLVAILDADKEGFLRSETSLIQTIGRAARNADGLVIMYADTVTDSMERAITETERRRAIQTAYNQAHGITPRTIVKEIRDSIEISDKGRKRQGNTRRMGKKEREAAIERLTREMKEAAKLLQFEHAAFLRDQIDRLRRARTPPPTRTPRPNAARTMHRHREKEENTLANDKIVIKGAREHNLKNVSLTLPRDKFIVMTGLSGSGKSSLAFDTIYADGQRRYVESLSSYARMFLGRMDKPDVDEITGLSPAISIDQKTTSHNPRSTVGTVTEIYDYLRLLYARIGVPHCPVCGRVISQQSVDEMVDAVLKLERGPASRCWPRWSASARAPSRRSWTPPGGPAIPRQGGRQPLRPGRGDHPGKEHQAHRRGGGGPPGHPGRGAQPPGRQPGNGPQPDRRGGRSGGDRRRDHDLQPELRLPGARRLDQRADPAAVLLQQPQGACDKCTGLGIFMKVDEDRIIPNPQPVHPAGGHQGQRLVLRRGLGERDVLPRPGQAVRFHPGYPPAGLFHRGAQRPALRHQRRKAGAAPDQ